MSVNECAELYGWLLGKSSATVVASGVKGKKSISTRGARWKVNTCLSCLLQCNCCHLLQMYVHLVVPVWTNLDYSCCLATTKTCMAEVGGGDGQSNGWLAIVAAA